METEVRTLRPEDVTVCEAILARLPDWFGIEAVNREYIEGLRTRPSVVAESEGRVVGFLSVERHGPGSAEIHVLAVDPDLHRRGAGEALVAWGEAWCREEGVRWLHVKTRGPLTPDPGYERTRHFYLAQGFEPLFESLELWGPQDSALILVKTVLPGKG